MNIGTLYIEPGSPWQNPYFESFNGTTRDKLTNREAFVDLEHARQRFAWHKDTYNHHRPHSSLGYMTPAAFAASQPDRLGPSALTDQAGTSKKSPIVGGS